jgi:monoamine oxidase
MVFPHLLITVDPGTQSIAEGLAASLSPGTVRLGIAVKSIVQTKGGVEVHSTDGHVFRGRKVIVAFSTPLYAKISFDPPLPAGKALLAGSTRLGYYTKVMAVYSKPWWRDNGFCGASQSFLGPAAATRDTSEDSRSMFRLTSFIAGQPGEEWSRLHPAERRAAVLAQLSHLFWQQRRPPPDRVCRAAMVFRGVELRLSMPVHATRSADEGGRISH